jgi:hypothetical protein
MALGAVLLSMGGLAQAQTIADWDFDSLGTTAPPVNTVYATSTGATLSPTADVATQLGMNNSYTFANGEGPGSAASGDILASAGASTGSGAFAWRVRGNGNTAGSGPGVANGWNSAAPIGTQGAEFSASTAGYNNITVTADVNATGQAERNLAVLYTLDDTAATPVWLNATITSAGSLGTLANNTTSANTISGNYVELSGTGTGWNNQITATIAGAGSDANFAVELVNASTLADDVNTSGNPLNNSSGNWRFDNVVISGSAVPEPSVLALLGTGISGLLWQVRRNRK